MTTLRISEHRRSAETHTPPFPPIIPFREWCKLRNITPATGRRYAAEGKVKLTRLSLRKMGVRADHDREFLDRCLAE
jgi:hypothetical protein